MRSRSAALARRESVGSHLRIDEEVACTTLPDRTLIETALAEDVGTGDITTDAIVSAELQATADIVVREPGVVCGLEFAVEVFEALDPGDPGGTPAADGDRIADRAGDRGHGRRQRPGDSHRASGWRSTSCSARPGSRPPPAATPTRSRAPPVELLDTRKTAPGLRRLDRHAVRCGGGTNHRFGLADAVLIKDNHIAIAGGVEAAVAAVLKYRPGVSIELEVDTLDQLDHALACGVDTVLLDNMPPAMLREAVRANRADGHGSKHQVGSPSKPSPRSPPPASTQSRSAP